MNMTQLDLTAAPAARVGSTVTLLGVDGSVTIGAEEWATWADTINYEIVARFPSELRREYADDSVKSFTA
jgi:alanine racemase